MDFHLNLNLVFCTKEVGDTGVGLGFLLPVGVVHGCDLECQLSSP
jgi:hypothetical protein